jgi:hypothetical protein
MTGFRRSRISTRAGGAAGGRRAVRRYFAGAKLLVVNTPHYYAVANLSKGGVWKAFDARGPIRSDTGLIAREAGPRGRTLVSHLVDSRNRVEVDANLRRARVEGAMCLRRAMLPTPAKQIVFRLINLTLGRFAPNLLRALLQKKLIVGKPRTDYRFAREIEFGEEGITVRDELRRPPDAPRIASVHAGSDATSIYVANSNVYQESVLLPWRSLGRGFLRRLNESGQARATLRLRLTARRTNPRGAQSSSGDPARADNRDLRAADFFEAPQIGTRLGGQFLEGPAFARGGQQPGCSS